MQLQNENSQNRETIIKTGLLLLGIGINTVEFFIPRIPLFPWLKPGFANIITLVWIIRYGFTESILYSMLRIWIVSFFFGFSFLTFTLGFSGALCSCCIMSLLWSCTGRYKVFGTIGISVSGALFHNMGQLTAIYFLMAGNSRIFFQIPLMTAASVLFGTVVGLLVPGLMKLLSDSKFVLSLKPVKNLKSEPVSIYNMVILLSLFLFCMTLVFIDNRIFLIITAVLITVFIQFLKRGSFSALLFPIKRFWMMFLFIGVFHSFFTYGMRYQYIPYITYEGVENAVTQWLRLWTWLETSFIFFHFRFHTVVFKVLNKIFTNYNTTLNAGILSVEYFPSVIENVRSQSGRLVKMLFSKPSHLLKEIFLIITNSFE